MAARACWLALACTLVGEVAAGVKPSVFISADGAPPCVSLFVSLAHGWAVPHVDSLALPFPASLFSLSTSLPPSLCLSVSLSLSLSL